MDAQRGDDGAQPAGVEFGTAVPGPPVGQVGLGAVDDLGDVAQVLLGMVDVNRRGAPARRCRLAPGTSSARVGTVSTTARSAAATSRPKASAQRSTCSVSTRTGDRQRQPGQGPPSQCVRSADRADRRCRKADATSRGVIGDRVVERHDVDAACSAGAAPGRRRVVCGGEVGGLVCAGRAAKPYYRNAARAASWASTICSAVISVARDSSRWRASSSPCAAARFSHMCAQT